MHVYSAYICIYLYIRIGESLQILEPLVADEPECFECWLSLGHTLSEIKQLARAIACYKKGLDLRPEDGDALLNYFHTKQQVIDWEQREELFERLINLTEAQLAQRHLTTVGPYYSLLSPFGQEQMLGIAESHATKAFDKVVGVYAHTCAHPHARTHTHTHTHPHTHTHTHRSSIGCRFCRTPSGAKSTRLSTASASVTSWQVLIVCMCLCACARVHACVSVCLCVRACVRVDKKASRSGLHSGRLPAPRDSALTADGLPATRPGPLRGGYPKPQTLNPKPQTPNPKP